MLKSNEFSRQKLETLAKLLRKACERKVQLREELSKEERFLIGLVELGAGWTGTWTPELLQRFRIQTDDNQTTP